MEFLGLFWIFFYFFLFGFVRSLWIFGFFEIFGFFFKNFLCLLKLLRVLLKVTKVTTGHQKLTKMGKIA